MSDNICSSRPCRLPLDPTHFVCPACHGAWHRHCWEREGGCAVCGCAKEPLVAGFSRMVVETAPATATPLITAWLVVGLMVGTVWGHFISGGKKPDKILPLVPAHDPTPLAAPRPPVPTPDVFRLLVPRSCIETGLTLRVDSVKDGQIDLELEDGSEIEIPLEWLELNDKDWVVGTTDLPEYGIKLEYTRARQLRMYGPGINLSLALGLFDREELEKGIRSAVPELAHCVPADRMTAFYDRLDRELRQEMERSLGTVHPQARLQNPHTGTDVTLLTDGSIAVNRAHFTTVSSAIEYFRRLIAQKAKPSQISLRPGDERWIQEFALPTMKLAFEGAPLRKGDHVHLVVDAHPAHGSFPRMAGELVDMASAKEREAVKSAFEAAKLSGPVKLVRDRAVPGSR